MNYREAGVDIDAGDALVEAIKPHARRTIRPEILAGLGGFGGLCTLPSGLHEPVLVSGTDGVGTKLKLAFELDRHDTIGIDLVAMSVNDILVQGAEPLFFLDYYACGKLDVTTATRVIAGIAEGCTQAGCTLIGGETAEMPGMYPSGEYDLAGFAVGVVEKSKIITGNTITSGDILLGLASNGPHSNGYSLIRKIIERNKIRLTDTFGPTSYADALLAPTRIYVKPILKLIQQATVKGIAHITGGGLLENIPRILQSQWCAHINASTWNRPEIFDWLREEGQISPQEMYRTFNCGIGLVLVISPDQLQRVTELLEQSGESVFNIGQIQLRAPNEPQVIIA
ncbi:MAG: phosphoribosylformylglycinamidine cyclo-ligase [Proteobacteria bacterium]|nr:phosphoribosylformylglycinamidine cyclo-ligase [Pseudomonadota bacterium]MDE3208301.1 phosphoribosylformylglycinamidine cyclo-ligase [Pseudomonadota bacterium]